MPLWLFIILNVIFFVAFFIGTAWLANMAMAWFAKRYSEKTRSKYQEKLEKLLPGKNCGECGCETCKEYAAAVFYSRADENKCPHGKETLPEDMKKVMAEFLQLLEGESVEDVKKAEKERRFHQ